MAKKLVRIKHYPFARLTLYREVVVVKALQEPTCESCGGQLLRISGRATLFRYYTQADDSTQEPVALDKLFCSIDCMRGYHEYPV